jgi:methionine synthase II (cobalamin-independent)
MRATGVGSLPGEDFADAFHTVLGEVGDLPFIPELPARGVSAAMIGRTAALFEDLAVDLQPAGWRLTSTAGRDQRRARSMLAHDLDVVEELLPATATSVKQQLAGPWTLAASIERPRGDRILADHGARHEVAESMAEGLRAHIADLRRRAPHADLLVQIDEPALPAVLAGAIPTASGYGRHRNVDDAVAGQLLRLVVDAIRDAGATPVAHCCAADVPVSLLADAGFEAISFDLTLARADEAWAQAFEAGTDLWPGVIPASGALGSPAEVRRQIDRWFGDLGFDDAAYGEGTVITATCGLAGSTPDHARAALTLAQRAASGS